MRDIWSFLLQTLTASGVAALLLCVKAMFRDKLSPRWQFGVWGVLAAILLLPAGRGGRYVLLNWPMLVEALRSAVTGDFGTLTRVTAPIPLLPRGLPKTAAEWLYLVYITGVIALLARYLVSYVCLRRALKRGRPVRVERIREVGERYGLPVCPAVEVDGLSTAFICGLFRPVLALPAGAETDGKVILHELLHLKYRDVAWGWVICLFRCVHWCNPLLWLCADWAGNDLESLCDQRVLERLEGEERRDYGRILLSMADEKYARTPGTSSAANGGRNIRRRIEAIARFKRYPAGMALVSVCVVLVLAAPLVTGAQAGDDLLGGLNDTTLFASARTNYCTTYAGAFDAYAKAVLMGSPVYRAMCAPLEQQNELVEVYSSKKYWEYLEYFGLKSATIEFISGYSIYNLNQVEEDVWEGVLVIQLVKPPEGVEWDGLSAHRWLAIQRLRAEKEGERWVVLPQEDIWTVQGDAREGGNLAVPAWVYEGEYGDFTLRIQWQTMASASSNNITSSNAFFGISSAHFDPTPNPHAEFDQVSMDYITYAVYHGDPDRKGGYTGIGVSCVPIYGEPDGRPGVEPLDEDWLGSYSTGSSSGGSHTGTRILEDGWDDWIFLSGGGGSYTGNDTESYSLPRAYAVDLYLNGKLAAELTLLPEGGEWYEPGQ